MTRSPGLFHLLRRRLATPRSAALVIVVLVTVAAFVIAAAPRALVAVERAEVAHQIDGIAPTSRDLTVEVLGGIMGGAADDPAVVERWDDGAADELGAVGQALADHRADFDPALAGLAGEGEFYVVEDPVMVVPWQIPADDPLSVVQLLAEPAATSHLELVDGAWPSAWTDPGGVPEGQPDSGEPIEIVLAVDAAERMGWPVGQERGIPMSVARPASMNWQLLPTMRLVGTVEAVDPDAERWLHLPPALTATYFDDGDRRPTATAVAWVNPAGWTNIWEMSRSLVAWYPVDGEGALQADAGDLLSAVRGATAGAVPLETTGTQRGRFETDVRDVLQTSLARAGSAGAILAVATVGPLAVAVSIIVLAGTLMIRRRRVDLALLSARGAPASRLRRLLFIEGALLGLPAAAVGAAAGVVLTPEDAGPLPTIVAVLVGLAPALALAFSLRTNLRERRDADPRAHGRARVLTEATVVLLAVLAVVLLVVRGIGDATAGIDPLVVAAPLLATVALALVVVRLHLVPLTAALAIARRGRGVVSLVGAARNLRDPAAGTTAVLAMLVAVAIAVFSSIVLATVDRGAAVAAQRDVGADIQLSGPYFEADVIERLRGVDGVEDAVGVQRGDYLTVEAGDGRKSVLVVTAEVEGLAAVQRGYVSAVPAGRIEPGADPIDIIVSRDLSDEIGGGAATIGERDADIVGVIERIPGMSMSTNFVLVDASDYTDLTGFGFHPRVVMVDVADGADPAAVAAALDDAVGQNHATQLLDASSAEIRSSPAVSALRVVLLSALAGAAALSVLALLLVAGVSRDARSRVIALLRTQGLDRRLARGIVAWEFAPLGVTALVGGLLLGAALPLLAVASIDLRPFTGGSVQPAPVIDPVLTAVLVAVVALALGLAVVAGVLSARTTSLATVLRTEED
ncbi:FtsX-like permease family protein [Microbacterium sp. bgisy189]|uniref:FtsX-like permease family protein n=1 Tax=Microbacterium sp. bgisy189 TaxID=3413798 RepID=UPI003EBAB28F